MLVAALVAALSAVAVVAARNRIFLRLGVRNAGAARAAAR